MAMVQNHRLASSEHAFRSIFENAVEGIFQTLPDGRYVRVNPALARIYGYDSPEDLLNNLTDIATQLYVDADRRAEFMSLMESRGEVAGFESSIRCKDGGARWISENARAVRDLSGELLYYEGFVVDITDRKESESVRSRLESELQNAHTMSALGSVAGGVSHDFKTLLCVIGAHAEMIHDRSLEGGDTIENVDAIFRVVDRGIELVDRIGIFSRSAASRAVPVKVDELIVDVVRMLQGSLPPGVRIRRQIELDAGHVLADPSEIFRLVINLCTNAFRAMDESGGELTVRLSVEPLNDDGSFAMTQAGNHLCLAVEDTGVGMSGDMNARVFEPGVTTKEGEALSGVGLAIVRGIVEGLDGKIDVQSALGVGTCIRVWLPVYEPEPESGTVLGRLSGRLRTAMKRAPKVGGVAE